MTLKLITEPSTEPVSLAEARLWCKLSADDTTHDDTLSMLITALRVQAEQETGRSFLSTTWEQVLDDFPASELELKAQPVASITSIKYLDTSGVEQTLSSSAYVLDDASNPAFVLPAAGYEWPTTYGTSGVNNVRVRFVQGWSSDTNPRVQPLRRWLRMMIVCDFDGLEPPEHLARALDCYRTYGA